MTKWKTTVTVTLIMALFVSLVSPIASAATRAPKGPVLPEPIASRAQREGWVFQGTEKHNGVPMFAYSAPNGHRFLVPQCNVHPGNSCCSRSVRKSDASEAEMHRMNPLVLYKLVNAFTLVVIFVTEHQNEIMEWMEAAHWGILLIEEIIEDDTIIHVYYGEDCILYPQIDCL